MCRCQLTGYCTSSTIFPICVLASMRACASAALASGKVLSITGLDLAGGDERQHALLDRARDRAFVRDRACAQGRAGMGEPLHHDAAEIDRGLRAGEKGDLHDAPVDRGGFVVALDVVAADHVEDDVGALAAGRVFGRGDEIFGLIVNGDVGAELAAGLAFLRRAGGRDDAGAEGLGELDRGRADAGRAAVDQQRLAGLEPAALEGVVPDREEGLGDRCGLDQREPCRHRQAVAFVRRAILAHSRRRRPAPSPGRRASIASRPAPSATTSPAISRPGMSVAPLGGG